jgi:hypothetical protein
MGTSAPPITLGVTVHPDSRATSITNVGEVCWGAPTDGFPFQACDDDAVTVSMPGLAATGGTAPTGAAVVGGAAIAIGVLALIAAYVRRRRPGAVAE